MPFDGTNSVIQQASDAMDRAAALIRKHGLAKGVQRDWGGRLCIHGALSVAISGETGHISDPLHQTATHALYLYLKGRGEDYILPTGVAGWNNQAERTAEEVIAALQAAKDFLSE